MVHGCKTGTGSAEMRMDNERTYLCWMVRISQKIPLLGLVKAYSDRLNSFGLMTALSIR